MMRLKQSLGLILCGWAVFSWGWYIYHPGKDLTRPEVFWPDENGVRPTADSPMQWVEIKLDRKLAGFNYGENLFLKSLLAWQLSPKSEIRIFYSGAIDLSGKWYEHTGDGINAVMLVEKGWGVGASLVALTELEYNTQSSRLIEADIYLNGEDYQFGNLDFGTGNADLANILTHELGHFLGLGHSQVWLATMSNSTRPSETRRRTLHPDDRQALSWLYPSDSTPPPPSLWKLRKETCQWRWEDDYSPEVLDKSMVQAEFCLYGAGFLDKGYQLFLLSARTGEKKNPFSNLSYLSENLFSLQIDLSQLVPDSYGLILQDGRGRKSYITQALIIKQPGNSLPIATIQPEKIEIELGEEVELDGSGSYDPEGSPLDFNWLVIDSDHPLELSNSSSAKVLIQPEQAGDYLIGLMVDDGVNFSLMAQALVSVSPEASEGCGCQLVSKEGKGSFFLPGFLILLFLFALKLWESGVDKNTG